jgi:hypothetical protein
MTRDQMDALVDGHYRAEEAADIDAIVDGFVAGAAHDVAGRPGGEVCGLDAIASYYPDAALWTFIEAAERHGHWLAGPEENAAVGLRVG